MNDLKPCPFCGGKAQEKFVKRPGLFPTLKFPYTTHTVYIRCEVCLASSGVRFVREEAIEAWNRRADNG